MKLSPKIEERATPYMLVPEYYPDGRLVFLERDLTRREWAGIAIAPFPVVLFAALIGGMSDSRITSWVCWALAGVVAVACLALLVQIARYAPVNRSLVIDPARGIAGVREARKKGVLREVTRPLSDCRIERGFLGTTLLKCLDRPVLVFLLPDGPGEIQIVLAAIPAKCLDEYSALLPKSLRDRIIVTTDHRVVRARPITPYPARDLHLEHLRRMRFCRSCGYDLIGLEGVRCPECGLGRWGSE